MNANLRGDVKVKGLSIEDFIRNIVSKQLTSSQKPVVQEIAFDMEDVIRKKMQPLEAFQDEKKIMTDALARLVERVSHLETVTASAAPPSVDFKPDIDVLTNSIYNIEKKMTEMKPRRGVDQITLDTAIADVEKKIEDNIKTVSDALGELRKELEE